MLKRSILASLFLLGLVFPALAGTRVWLHYGLGDNIFGSSAGIDQIAAVARTLPGVAQVTVHNYWQTQQTADEIMAAPPGDRIVVGGYSCGANASTTIAYGLNPHRKIDVAVIQESYWCGGFPLLGNVNRAQETYAAGPLGFLLTLGFGSKEMTAGPGFNGTLLLINRPDLHPYADLDPNAQRDVLSFIAGTNKSAHFFKKRGPVVTHIIRYNGQRS